GVIWIFTSQLTNDTSGNLGNFERMRESRSVEIAIAQGQDLGFTLQSAKGARVHNTSIVNIERVSRIVGVLLPTTLPLDPSVGHGQSAQGLAKPVAHKRGPSYHGGVGLRSSTVKASVIRTRRRLPLQKSLKSLLQKFRTLRPKYRASEKIGRQRTLRPPTAAAEVLSLIYDAAPTKASLRSPAMPENPVT